MSAPAASSLQAGTTFPQLGAPFVDPQTGLITQPWQQFLIALYKRTGSSLTPLGVSAYVGLTAGGQLVAYRADDNSVIGRIETSSGAAPAPAAPVPLGSSPASYTASSSGLFVVDSGKLELVRGGSAYTLGLAGGSVRLLPGDTARVTYYRATPTAGFFGD